MKHPSNRGERLLINRKKGRVRQADVVDVVLPSENVYENNEEQVLEDRVGNEN